LHDENVVIFEGKNRLRDCRLVSDGKQYCEDSMEEPKATFQ